jgi:hypothetical protein
MKMGVSEDRGMGVRFRTNNEDRSALVGKYYSGCLCWLFDRTLGLTKRLYKNIGFFCNAVQTGRLPNDFFMKQAIGAKPDLPAGLGRDRTASSSI